MSTFSPEKLSVTFMSGTNATHPLIPRRYTLTHSDDTGELFLNIGAVYAWGKINPSRDEVFGEWRVHGDCLVFQINILIDQGEYSFDAATKRNEIFRRELPLALSALRYGDRLFFKTNPYLDFAPIMIRFNSCYKEFLRHENWGTFSQFTKFH